MSAHVEVFPPKSHSHVTPLLRLALSSTCSSQRCYSHSGEKASMKQKLLHYPKCVVHGGKKDHIGVVCWSLTCSKSQFLLYGIPETHCRCFVSRPGQLRAIAEQPCRIPSDASLWPGGSGSCIESHKSELMRHAGIACKKKYRLETRITMGLWQVRTDHRFFMAHGWLDQNWLALPCFRTVRPVLNTRCLRVHGHGC